MTTPYLLTAFQIAHDMEPTTTGAGYQLWNRLNQLTYTLDYTQAAHQQAHDTLQKLQDLHDQLRNQLIAAAITLGALIALAFIPGVDLADAPGAAVEGSEVAAVGDTMTEMAETGQTLKTAEEAGKTAQELGQISKDVSLLQMLATAAKFATVATVTLIVLLSIPSDSSPSNTLPPLSDKKKISQLSDKEFNRILAELAREFGCSQAEIEAIINKYGANKLTPKQLERILRMLRLKAQLEALRSQLQNSNIPGASRLVGKIDELLGGVFARDPTTWTDANITSVQGALDGIWGNYSAAQQSGGTVSQDHTCGGNSQEVDVDQGNTWVEVKNQGGLSPSSDKFTALFNQLLNYIRVGRCEGVTNFDVDVPPDADISGLQNAINGRLTQMGIYGVKVTVRKINFGSPPGPAGGWCTA